MISAPTPTEAPGGKSPSAHGPRIRLVALVLLLACLLYVWRQKPSSLRPAGGEWVSLPADWNQIQTEEHWIAAEIGGGIAEMLSLAAAQKTPAAAGIQFRSKRGPRPKEYLLEASLKEHAAPVQMKVITADYVWAPENFVLLARQLVSDWSPGAAHQRSPVDPEIFLRLITPTPEALVREDKRLSAALTKSPLDAELHEEAALLIGSFALRHAALSFYDVRRELSRLTAHLAIARALDERGGPCGDLAEAILCTLAGRQSPALDLLQRLDRNADTPAGMPLVSNTIWHRSLAMRNTGDYRILDQPEHASLLERLECVRALRYHVNSAAASAFLLRFPAEKLAEWSNLLLAGNFSVSEGHLWAARAVSAEIEEIAAEYRQYHGKALAENEWSAALSAPNEHIAREENQAARLEVLGWGSWAGLHQRQLCQVLKTTWEWLDDSWGVPEQALAFKDAITPRFAQLHLFPLINMEHAPAPNRVREYEAHVQSLVEAHPDWVPFSLWSDAVPGKHGLDPRGTHAPLFTRVSWFNPVLPSGTVYDDGPARQESVLCSLSNSEIDQVKALAPYNVAVLFQQLQRAKKNRPTPDEIAGQFETLRAYDTWAMRIVADGWKADPDRYEPAFLQICHFEPDLFIKLGDYLVEQKRPEAAARAYQNAVDHAPDRVYVSNRMRWLVDYYYTQGRRKEAFAVAEMAADAYSAEGLKTMATLLERDGQLTRTETYLNKIAERYKQSEPLMSFYGRHRQQNTHYAGIFDSMMAKIFPHGEELADVASMSGAPPDGVVLSSSNHTVNRAGMKRGDVIVAVNGVRARNSQQYRYLMDRADSSKIQLGFWSARNYRSVVVNLPERRLGVTISDLQR